MNQPRILAFGLALTFLSLAGCGTAGLPLGANGHAVGTAQTASLKSRQMPAGYYDAAEGQQGSELLRTLNRLVSRHKDLGYDGAREAMFKTVDDLDDDNVVTCIYIGRTLANVTDTKAAYQGGAGLNAEHTWPQSLGAVGPAKADLHHLFPADCKANSTRGSFPFGEVKDVQWNQGGSKCGLNAQGVRVFEPRDEQKGNTARALLYFYTVYGLEGRANTSNFRIEEETLKRWSAQDPVTAEDRARNDAVYAVQGNRNPFVDHPEYISAVGKFLNSGAR